MPSADLSKPPVGDGVADDTAALQAAVDEVANRGGGRVTLRAGHTYRCGSLRLRDHVELHLEGGSRLVAVADPQSYSRKFIVGALTGGTADGNTVANGVLIWAEDAQDVSITGTGVIDGSAHEFVLDQTSEIYRMNQARPFPVFMVGCTQVTIRDVRFVNSALWTVRLSGCTDVRVDGVRIDNDMRVPNADGLNFDHCRRVRVSGCDIRTPDDGICLKSTDEFTHFGGCSDVVITGCTVESRSTGITLGADTDKPLRRVVISDSVIRAHRGVSISIGTGLGGFVEDVLMTGLVIEAQHDADEWWGSAEPILIRTAPWHTETGAIRRVTISNVRARAESGIVVYASHPGTVHDLELSSIQLQLARWTDHPGGRQDLRPIDNAEPFPGRPDDINGLRPIAPPAVHLEGVHSVRLSQIGIDWDSSCGDEFGPELLIEQCADVRWRDFEVSSDAPVLRVDGHDSALPQSGTAGSNHR